MSSYFAHSPFVILPLHRGVAQLAEHRSPKPGVESSSPSAPAIDARFVEVRRRKDAAWKPSFERLFSLGLYKRSQGRIARQATFAAFAVLVVLGAWSMSAVFLGTRERVWRYYIPLAMVAVGLWASFRVVQIPAFADFLISVEGEMNKVSWPSRGELFRASVVVILVIFFLAFLLFGYDTLLSFIMKGIDGLVNRMVGE